MPHTADLIVEAWVPTKHRLEEAALALVESFATPDGDTRRRVRIRVGAAPDEDLLVAVLEEVIYLADVDGAIPTAAHLGPGPGGEVEGWFDVVDITDAEVVGSAPKAVSRSELRFGQVAGQWRCRAVIDV